MQSQRTAKICVEAIFEKYTSFIANNPWKVVIFTITIQVLFGLSLITRTLNNDIEELYTPRNGITDKNIRRLQPFYPDASGNRYLTIRSVKKPLYADVVITKPDTGNKSEVVTSEDLRLVVETVSRVAFPTRYYNADLSRVCAKWTDKCVISVSENIDLTQLLVLSKFKIDTNDVFSQLYESKSDIINRLHNPVKVRFHLRQDTEAYYQDSLLWQHAFVREFKNWNNTINNVSVFFSHSASFLQEVGNDTYPDIRVFSLAFAIFLTYCGFLISGGDCVSKRMNIGRMGSIVVPLAVLGSWGFLSGVGMTFTNIVGVMPFFLVFHEVNLVLYILTGVNNNMDEVDGTKRVIKAVQQVAVPSLAVLLAHLVPFGFVIISKYRALETIAIYTVATVLVNFLTHFSFFVGCLAIHERRIDASRHSCTCRKVKPRDDPENEGRGCCFICCCTGRRPSSRDQVQSFLERLPRIVFSRLLLLKQAQVVLILLLLACAGTSVWKLMGTRIDTIQETDVTSASYFRQYYEVDRQYFVRRDVFSFVVSTGEMTFTQNKNLNALLSIYEKIKRLPFMDSKKSVFWLSEFRKLNMSYSSEDEFLSSVQQFLAKHPDYETDVVWEHGSKSRVIHQFRFYITAQSLDKSENMIIAKELVEKIVRDSFEEMGKLYDVKARVHAPSLWLIDSYKAPMYELARFAAIQLGVVVLLICLFGTGFFAVLHALFWYPVFAFCILACLTLLGVTINIVSTINLMIGLCYCTEVLLYYLFDCMYSEGTSNTARVYNVIQQTTPILFNTTFGTLCGLCILLLEKSYVFITVFMTIGVSVAVAWIHSFAFLPSVLAVVSVGRPRLFKTRDEKPFKIDITTVANFSDGTKCIDAVTPGEISFEGGRDNIGFTNNEELTKL